VIRSKKADSPCAPNAVPWILGSSMAFIDETAVTVALLAVAGVLVTVLVVAHGATALPLSSLYVRAIERKGSRRSARARRRDSSRAAKEHTGSPPTSWPGGWRVRTRRSCSTCEPAPSTSGI
jgi:hypothetical protein